MLSTASVTNDTVLSARTAVLQKKFDKVVFVAATDIFEPSLMAFTEPMANKKSPPGVRSSYISYSKKDFFIQLPPMRNPFQVKGFTTGSAPPSYKIHLNVEKDSAIHNMLASIDEVVKENAKANPLKWVKRKTLSEDELKLLYAPCLKYTKTADGEISTTYDPTVSVKIPCYNDNGLFESSCSFFDGRKKPITVTPDNVSDMIPSRCTITAIVKCKSVYMTPTSFGIVFELVRAIIIPASIGIIEFVGINDSTEPTIEDDQFIAAIEGKAASTSRSETVIGNKRNVASVYNDENGADEDIVED